MVPLGPSESTPRTAIRLTAVTDRPRYSVYSSRPHLSSAAMRPRNNSRSATMHCDWPIKDDTLRLFMYDARSSDRRCLISRVGRRPLLIGLSPTIGAASAGRSAVSYSGETQWLLLIAAVRAMRGGVVTRGVWSRCQRRPAAGQID